MQLSQAETNHRLSILGAAGREGPSAYLDAARGTLRELLARPDLLRGIDLDRIPGRYAPNLIVGNAQVSIFAMVWSPGATTSIHDHHCSCCFGVLSGALRESRFEAIGAGLVRTTHDTVRDAGFTACFLPTGPNIHQMANDGDREAISIHIYGYDYDLRNSSVDREYRLAAP